MHFSLKINVKIARNHDARVDIYILTRCEGASRTELAGATVRNQILLDTL